MAAMFAKCLPCQLGLRREDSSRAGWRLDGVNVCQIGGFLFCGFEFVPSEGAGPKLLQSGGVQQVAACPLPLSLSISVSISLSFSCFLVFSSLLLPTRKTARGKGVGMGMGIGTDRLGAATRLRLEPTRHCTRSRVASANDSRRGGGGTCSRNRGGTEY